MLILGRFGRSLAVGASCGPIGLFEPDPVDTALQITTDHQIVTSTDEVICCGVMQGGQMQHLLKQQAGIEAMVPFGFDMMHTRAG